MKTLFIATVAFILSMGGGLGMAWFYDGSHRGTTALISVASDGTQSNGNSYYPAIAADGLTIVFDSDATTLTPNDSNGQRDIFLYERSSGESTLLSHATDGTPSDGFSEFPILSGDGRMIAYHSDATTLVGNDTNTMRDIFAYERDTNTTLRLSLAWNGAQGNGDSERPALSWDGGIVVFHSEASNLVPQDTNGATDIFLLERATHTITRISVASDGMQGDGDSILPVISRDGRYVAFASLATNLVAGDYNGLSDIFVHDRTTGETTRISVASDGTEGDGDSRTPTMDGDGKTIAYISLATHLVPDDRNQAEDIFIYERETGRTTRISVASNGAEGNDRSLKPSISADGQSVAFYSFASNLVAGDTNDATDVFLHDRAEGTTIRISLATDGRQGDNYSYDPAISANGTIVTFSSDAATLVTGDSNARHDIFVHTRPHHLFFPSISLTKG